MRYLILLYLGVVSMLAVEPDPRLLAPLVIVAVSFAFSNRWIGIGGVLLFGTFTLNAIQGVTLMDIYDIFILSAGMIFPMIIMLELILSARPYRIERISASPIIVTVSLIMLFWAGMFIVVRMGGIGIFLGSNISTQIFLTISLSLLLTGPFLISSGSRHNRSPKNEVDGTSEDNNR